MTPDEAATRVLLVDVEARCLPRLEAPAEPAEATAPEQQFKDVPLFHLTAQGGGL